MSEQKAKVVIKGARLSYANVHQAVTQKGSTTPKYSVNLLWPKTDREQTAAVNAAIAAAEAEGVASKWGGKKPKVYKNPALRDGDEFENDEKGVYAGMWYVVAKANEKPLLLSKSKEPIADKTEIYSGCYCHGSVNFYPYDTDGNKGIACGLNGLMKYKDGEALAGRGNVLADFDDLEGDTSEDDDLAF